MLLAPVRVAPPGVQAISLAEVKAHLRVDFADEDMIIAAYQQAAIDHFDGWSGVLGRCLISQQWRVSLSAFPCGDTITLPFPDVSAVDIAYSDADDAYQILAASAYRLLESRDGSVITLKSGQVWPATFDRPDALRITLTAGYGAAPAAIPAPIRAAMLLRAGDLYARREDASKPGGIIDILVTPYNRNQLGSGPR